MKIKKIQEIDYQYGQEESLKKLLYRSKEPIVLKIESFSEKYNLDYFEKLLCGEIGYDTYENNLWKSYQSNNYETVIKQMKNNMAYRIFGLILPRQLSAEIENHVPLWQKIPLRPRYFNKKLKVAYFLGGKGAHTEIHFDREHCCILHLCLSGKKQFLLFTEDQNKYIYKLPYIGDSLIEFGYPWDALCHQFPRLNQAEGYNIILEPGDMLFLPKNCWHYTTYLEASAAASYVFYPNKLLQFYGYFTGYFFMGYKEANGFKIADWPFFKKFSERYAVAEGKKKFLFKLIEVISYAFLLPIISIITKISFLLKPRRTFY
ncbi:eukaryotic small stress protein PASS1 [Legionella gratiana]|uniref:Eukaryotic small stress protein n=1 Tax=Legionella gratiana TaxID=45066 RepID=A0A378IZW8_9GAMM|nr:cupin-like domain-containing protein [Legionella gratiana]KTD11712.1 eukaryotic small stress protein PASS1 [Legionella gratiana]STX40799.1 eukaryotic small stress protein [Legionella gratiana]